MRWSKWPSKQLLYFWLRHSIPKHSRCLIGLDVGCGSFAMYPLFRSQKYVGLDIHPQVVPHHAPDFIFKQTDILDLDGYYGFFVLCIQVLTNKHFDKAMTLELVDRLIEMVEARGTLIINTSKATKIYEPEIELKLQEYFKRITIRRYGAWSRQRTMFAPLLAGIMWLIPWLRHRGCHTKTYYVCEGKQ